MTTGQAAGAAEIPTADLRCGVCRGPIATLARLPGHDTVMIVDAAATRTGRARAAGRTATRSGGGVARLGRSRLHDVSAGDGDGTRYRVICAAHRNPAWPDLDVIVTVAALTRAYDVAGDGGVVELTPRGARGRPG